jgi:hypothetical protein
MIPSLINLFSVCTQVSMSKSPKEVIRVIDTEYKRGGLQWKELMESFPLNVLQAVGEHLAAKRREAVFVKPEDKPWETHLHIIVNRREQAEKQPAQRQQHAAPPPYNGPQRGREKGGGGRGGGGRGGGGRVGGGGGGGGGGGRGDGPGVTVHVHVGSAGAGGSGNGGKKGGSPQPRGKGGGGRGGGGGGGGMAVVACSVCGTMFQTSYKGNAPKCSIHIK